jgi:microcystin-dependent protein
MATRLLPPGYQQLDANGAPVSGAKLYTYSAGTTTPKATYSDAGLTILNSNPVEADAAGRFGDIFATTGSYALVMETSAGAPIWDADPVDGATGSTASPGAGIRNLLTDGDFASVALLTATGVDGAGIADNWYALNQSNNTTAALQTLQQDGIPNNLRITQANASAQRYGVAQVIPAADSYRARGSSVTLSGKIRHSLAAPIRYAVLAWTGTADAPTKDVVNDWTSASYTAGGFFNSTTLTVVGVGSVTPTASIWTDITALTGAVSSSATNLIVMVWTEGATVQNATLDVSQLQLEVAAAATAYEFLPSWLGEAQTGNNFVPTGAVMPFAMNTAPAGWMKCNGAAVSRTTYARLFAAIGTTFGVGDGSTTFNLPELRAEFVRGWDDSRGTDSGRVFGSTQTDAFQGHFHAPKSPMISFWGNNAGAGSGQPAGGAFGVETTTGAPAADGTNGTPRTAAETRPRNVALLYCIKF